MVHRFFSNPLLDFSPDAGPSLPAWRDMGAKVENKLRRANRENRHGR